MRPFSVTRYRDFVKGKLGLTPGQMLREVYEAQGRDLFAQRQALRHSIHTMGQWRAEARAVHRRFCEALGEPIPRHTNPRVRVCRSIKRGRLEFRSLLVNPFDKHWISATLVLPRRIDKPAPAIILAHGHSMGGRSVSQAAHYAANGYAAIAFDLIGGGERYLPAADGTCFAPNTGQHNLLGAPMGLLGYNLGWLMLADASAMVDVLQATPEVDGARIGMTGASGGAWCTFFAAAMDERIAAAAPNSSVHSFKNRLYPSDAEQVLFNPIARGLHYPDIASFLIAPRPLFIVANTRDIWDIDGTRYVAAQASRFYRLHRASDRMSLRAWRCGHEGHPGQGDAILRWFNRWLGNKASVVAWNGADMPSASELRVSRTGNLYTDGLRPPLRVVHERASRTIGAGARSPDAARSWLRRAIGSIPSRVAWQEIDAHPAGPAEGRRIIFETQRGLWLPAEMLLPPKNRGVMILLDELDRRDGQDWQARAAASGFVVIRPDLRGCGEAALEESWEDWENVVQRHFSGRRQVLSALAHLIGHDVNIERVRDVAALIRVARHMRLRGPVVLWGRRVGALVATLAAVALPQVRRLIVEDYLHGFDDVFRSDLHMLMPDEFVFDLLRKGSDLPELRRSLGRGSLVARRPLDPFQRPRGC